MLTFEPHPREFFDPASAPARLTTLREKLELLQNYGADGTLSEGIARECARLAPVKERAHLVIDTSVLSVHGLRERIAAAFGDEAAGTVAVTVESFGFKYGLPKDADFAGFAAATIKAAATRYGADSEQERAVRTAWEQVKVVVSA